jgi:hypothetical protein
MIYGPRGYAVAKHIADPNRLSSELIEPYRVASQTSQWNWSQDAITDGRTLEANKSVVVQTAAVGLSADPPFQAGTGDEYPHMGTPTAEIWYVPFNISNLEVGDGDMALEWDSEYPELVWCAFSFQYARADMFWMNGSTLSLPVMPRLRWDISVDGTPVMGTGAYSNAEDANTRGSGVQERVMSPTVNCVIQLQAGSHRVTPVVSMGPSVYSEKPHDDGSYDYVVDESEVADSAAILNRRMTVIRFAKGGWLEH